MDTHTCTGDQFIELNAHIWVKKKLRKSKIGGLLQYQYPDCNFIL